jgi:hypothetical protein
VAVVVPRAAVIRAVLALAAIVPVLATATPAAGASHATVFKAGRVLCGVMVRPIGGIQCHSAAIPAPYGTDGYVALHRHGPATLGERGDCAFRRCGPIHRLQHGERWRRVGVTCVLRRKLRCHNRDGHGFKLTHRSYSLF